MKFLIASDKYKESLGSDQANQVIARAIRQIVPKPQVRTVTASDGGDGFLEALQSRWPRLVKVLVPTVDAIQRPLTGCFLWDQERRIAFLETAIASGLATLPRQRRCPSRTSTRGTGLILDAALEAGARKIVLGLGGSATHDLGLGIAAACGFRFLDADGVDLPPMGRSLGKVATVLEPAESVRDARQRCQFVTVNDVQNPLVGPTGAAQVFAPQKGADEATVMALESGTRKFLGMLETDRRWDSQLADQPGAGAAGGLGFGMRLFFNAQPTTAADWLLDSRWLGKNASLDWVVTGEGRLDRQTGFGKWIAQVARLGRSGGARVAVFCGISELDAADREQLGVDTIVPLHDPCQRSTAESMKLADRLLYDAVSEWARGIADQEPRDGSGESEKLS